jgi:hypothetical protein
MIRNSESELLVSRDIRGNGEMHLTNNTLQVQGALSLENITYSDATVVFNGVEPQRITGHEFFNILEISNPAGVRITAENDVIVEEELRLVRAMLSWRPADGGECHRWPR